jgi:AraC-like DNA-binding protein
MEFEHLRLKERHNHLNGIGFGVSAHPGFEARADRRMHTHDVVEINYFVAGRGTHYLGGHAFPARPGSLGIIHYTQRHGFLTDEPMDIINVFLDLQRFALPDLGEELSRALYRILPMHPSLRHRRDQFVQLQFEPGGPQEIPQRGMLAEQDAGAPGYREAMRSQLRLLLIACARQAERQGAYPLLDEVGETEHKVETLRRELDADPAGAVSLDALARRLDWSKPHLCRAFKRHTGSTITEYLQRQRIAAAMARLRTTRDRVTEIALACGFNDQSYFNRAFRAVVGSSPRAYRRSLGVGL